MAVKQTRTACVSCHARCGAIVTSDGDKILKIEGDPENPKSRGAFCSTGMSQREIHEDVENRIIYPMKRVGPRGSGEWTRITWDEALNTIASECLRIKEEYGPEAIITGQGTGRTTNHWHCRLNSSLGLEGWSMAPTHVCLMPHLLPNAFTLGLFNTGAGDVTHAGVIVIWGYNPAMMRSITKTIYDSLDRGCKMVGIDTRFTDFANISDVHLQPRPGTDGALALALIHEVIENEWYDKEFIERWAIGFDELAARAKEWPPERAAEICWLDVDDIREAARLIGTSGPAAFEIFTGPGCMHTNAIQTGRAIACLQGLLGYIDQPGGPLAPLSFDKMLDDKITLWDPTKSPARPDLFTFGGEKHPLYKAFGRANDPHSVFEAMITGEPRPVKAYIGIASDPIMCYEDANFTRKALTSENLDLLVIKDFYMSPTAQIADIVLPTSDWSERDTWDEEMENNMMISVQRAVDPPGECWDDWKFFLELGKRIKPEDWPWADEKEMVLWRANELYGLGIPDWETWVSQPFYSTEPGGTHGEPVFKKYEKGMMRPDGQPGFATASGKVELLCPTMAAFGYDPIPDYVEPMESPISTPELAKEYPLVLTTGFRLYSFFHSAWTNVPMQRKFYPDPFGLVHPDDAKKYGITNGEWMTVSSPRGKVIAKAKVSYEIKKGVIALPRPGWRDPCPELDLPGYGWEKSNPNILVPSEPAEPGFGATAMRSSLCKIEAGRGDL